MEPVRLVLLESDFAESVTSITSPAGAPDPPPPDPEPEPPPPEPEPEPPPPEPEPEPPPPEPEPEPEPEPPPLRAKDLDVAAEGVGYQVFVDGAAVSQHNTERRALKRAIDEKLDNPAAEVFYEHSEYIVRIEA